jgi:hypothetical protein
MMGTVSRILALASLGILLGVATASAQSECMTSQCQNESAIAAMQTGIAAECDCAGAPNAKKYMQCVKKSLNAAIAAGTFPRSCKTAVARCEAAVGCGKGIRPFRTIQTVFSQSCALSTCHSTLTRQGGLTLESEEVSYAALVDRPATHPEAGGAKLVVPGKPRDSFLIQKLRGTAPGDRMPQGGQLADGTIKLIERWIKRGAKATADECPPAESGKKKRKGKQCNDRPLRTGNYVWEPEPALEEPPPGTGVQLYTPPRPVAPGTEWEICYAFKHIDWPALGLEAGYAPGVAPIVSLPVIKRQVYRMHEGSHHLLLYAYMGDFPEKWADGFFPCSAAACEATNPQDCPPDANRTIPIGGTQVAGTRYEVNYPEGVGIPVLQPNQVLIANLHYNNPFQPAQEIFGEAWLNLEFYKPNEFKAILDGIFAVNVADLFVEPYETRTISRMWMPTGLLSRGSTDAAVFQLFGHMHKRGTEFQIDVVRGGTCSARPDWACGRDDDCRCWAGRRDCVEGQTCVKKPGAEDTPIYYTAAWDRAPVMEFQKPYLLVDKDEGLRWTCTHTNGVEGDPSRPPKRCHEGCEACGWNAATRTCVFTRGVGLGFHDAPRTYQEGEPMPVVFGELADDDMCNMFGYFINQSDLQYLD